MLTIDQWHTISKWLIVIGPITLLTMTLLLAPENRQRVGNVCLSMLGAGNPASRVQRVWHVIVIAILLLSAAVSIGKLVTSLRQTETTEEAEHIGAR